jgi:hypothetical protein
MRTYTWCGRERKGVSLNVRSYLFQGPAGWNNAYGAGSRLYSSSEGPLRIRPAFVSHYWSSLVPTKS